MCRVRPTSAPTTAATCSVVAVPVTLSSVFERIAKRHGGSILRTQVDIASLMYAASNTDVVMAADGTGIFIFPEFQPVADAMMAMVKLLEYLARHRLQLSEVVAGLPSFEVHSTTVPCSWENKGMVMRRLQQEFAEYDVQVVDGIKVFLNEWEWALARPDPDRPLFHIAAEAQTAARSEQILEEYARLVGRLAQNRLLDA